MLHIYNSLSGKKEPFKPLKEGKIGFYACGITVYDRCHLGHARSMLAFDVIVRFLRHQGYAVNFVRNITDIDDKIILRANERNLSIDALTKTYIDAMHEDEKALNMLPPDHEPRATTHMQSIIHLIERLIDNQYAYETSDGDVCFEVRRFKEYGKLSNKDIDKLESGVRIEVAEGKRSPLDFVLWKKAKQGEPSWPSPWGEGRPGWHIECSAMSMEALGEHFDIHGGGMDLQFPHHENEIAQSECATQKPFANYWMHVGLLQINGEKMSKSTGNFLTIEDALQEHHPEVLRYFLLSSHYRSPLNYAPENISNAHKALVRLYQSLKHYTNLSTEPPIENEWTARFNAAMNDDFNTPVALAVMFELSHALNKTNDETLARTLKSLASILGLLHYSADELLKSGVDSEEIKEIEALIQARLQARAEKNWARADELRTTLTALGIELEDSATGTTWRRIVE